MTMLQSHFCGKICNQNVWKWWEINIFNRPRHIYYKEKTNTRRNNDGKEHVNKPSHPSGGFLNGLEHSYALCQCIVLLLRVCMIFSDEIKKLHFLSIYPTIPLKGTMKWLWRSCANALHLNSYSETFHKHCKAIYFLPDFQLSYFLAPFWRQLIIPHLLFMTVLTA